ncbi:hypothetical protein ACNA33_28280, partial [Klebsiella pneumoniae]
VSDYLSNSLPPVDFKYIDLMYGILKSTALSSIAVLSIILRHIRLTPPVTLMHNPSGLSNVLIFPFFHIINVAPSGIAPIGCTAKNEMLVYTKIEKAIRITTITDIVFFHIATSATNSFA